MQEQTACGLNPTSQTIGPGWCDINEMSLSTESINPVINYPHHHCLLVFRIPCPTLSGKKELRCADSPACWKVINFSFPHLFQQNCSHELLNTFIREECFDLFLTITVKTTQLRIICLNPKYFPYGFYILFPTISKKSVLQWKKKNPTFHREKRSAKIYNQSLRQ